ncbi:unnamed protein product [Calypogeia fissa]
MVSATAGFCCRSSLALHTFESMAARLVPIQRGAFTAAVSAGLLKPLGNLWLANSASNSTFASFRRGLTEDNRFSPKWTLSNVGTVARRAYRDGDGGRPNNQVAEVYEEVGGQQQEQQQPQPQAENGEVTVPRPPVIRWEKDLANGVQLIGRVGRDVEIKYLDNGKVVATTSLAVNKSQRNEEPSWFSLEIWDELAEVAAHHVAKGEQIFVTGRIIVDKRMRDEVTFTNAKVIVRDFCFVEAYNERRPYAPPKDDGSNMDAPPRSWSPQQPSSDSAQGTGGPKGSSGGGYNEAALATEKRWQEYFADPSQWWDNRDTKRNPKAPDFKHKSTNEGLWVKSWNNPPWVEQQLAVLEEKKRQHKGNFGDSAGSQDKNLTSFKDSDFLY